MFWRISVLVLGIVVGGSVAGQSMANAEEPAFSDYTVLPGDSLESIALELDVSVADLVEWNGDSVGDLFVGMHIRVNTKREATVRARAQVMVLSGDTVAAIGERFNLSEMQLRVLNPSLSESVEPKEGDRLSVLAPVRSRRMGVDYKGISFRSRIRDPEWLGFSGLGYLVKNPGTVWGTRDTVEMLRLAFRRVALSFPNTAPFVVGDISRKRGGRFHPHVSHKNGLDIDLSFAAKDNEHRERFQVVTRETMDAEKTWEFMRAILENGHTEYIFADHRLQRKLYAQALAAGLSPAHLEEVFQYPSSRHTKRGIIRHARGHRNHMHVRFGFSKKYLSEEVMEALKASGTNPMVQLPAWLQGLFQQAG